MRSIVVSCVPGKHACLLEPQLTQCIRTGLSGCQSRCGAESDAFAGPFERWNLGFLSASSAAPKQPLRYLGGPLFLVRKLLRQQNRN